MFWSADHTWYVKAGQMYLPFGLRLQDQSAFILTASGINMTTPDKGVEFGWLKGHWDAQLAVSNGTAGGAATGNGKQTSLQLSYVESSGASGPRPTSTIHPAAAAAPPMRCSAGCSTGPIVWLGAGGDHRRPERHPGRAETAREAGGGELLPSARPQRQGHGRVSGSKPRCRQRPADTLEPGVRVHADPVPAAARRTSATTTVSRRSTHSTRSCTSSSYTGFSDSRRSSRGRVNTTCSSRPTTSAGASPPHSRSCSTTCCTSISGRRGAGGHADGALALEPLALQVLRAIDEVARDPRRVGQLAQPVGVGAGAASRPPPARRTARAASSPHPGGSAWHSRCPRGAAPRATGSARAALRRSLPCHPPTRSSA